MSQSPHVIISTIFATEPVHIPYDIDTVYLCAGITQLEQCRLNPIHTKIINIDAQIHLADYFLNKNAMIIYMSSSAVFSGEKKYYTISDEVNPATFYGECKAVVENTLQQMSKNIAIVRLTKVLTNHYSLILNWIRVLKEGLSISPFYDLSLCPISCHLVASCLQKIGDMKNTGIIHLSGERDISYLDIGYYLARLLQVNKSLIESKSVLDSLPIVEKIPPYTSLDMAESMKIFPGLDISFETTMNDLYGIHSPN